MSQATVRQLRHEFPKVYAAAQRKPVKITKRGKVIGTFTASKKGEKWAPPDFSGNLQEDFAGKLLAIKFVDFLDR
jgi:hypothetical protein